MLIETKRLRLVPLRHEDLQRAVRNKSRMADAIGLKCGVGLMDERMRSVYGIKAGKMTRDPENWLLYTYWQIVIRESGEIAGEVGLKGPPQNGKAEIGYGLEPEYRGNGYMAEAVRAFTAWALEDGRGIKTVIAQTDSCNEASRRVLERAGMAVFQRDRQSVWYQTV